MSKRITVTIADKEIVIDFGVNYFHKHFKDLSGIDMLSEGVSGFLTLEGFSIAAKMIVAGNMAVKSLESKYPEPAAAPDATVGEVEHYFYSQDQETAYKIIADLIAAFAPKKEDEEPGEAKTQEAQP